MYIYIQYHSKMPYDHNNICYSCTVHCTIIIIITPSLSSSWSSSSPPASPAAKLTRFEININIYPWLICFCLCYYIFIFIIINYYLLFLIHLSTLVYEITKNSLDRIMCVLFHLRFLPLLSYIYLYTYSNGRRDLVSSSFHFIDCTRR